MMKVAVRAAVVAALLLVAALPAAAIPYCWNCTCAHACTTKCWDGTGLDTCAHWRCVTNCGPIELQPAAQSDLFVEPVGEGCDVTVESLFAEPPAENVAPEGEVVSE